MARYDGEKVGPTVCVKDAEGDKEGSKVRSVEVDGFALGT